MKFFTFPALLAAALFSAVVVQPWIPSARSAHDAYTLEARVTSTRKGYVQVYPDTGAGMSEPTSVRVPIEANVAAKLHFNFPSGDYRAFRLDPLDRDGTVTISDVRVVAKSGSVVREISPTEWRPAHDIASLRIDGPTAIVAITAGASDPQLLVSFATPLTLRLSPQEARLGFLVRWLGVLAGAVVVLLGLDLVPAPIRGRLSAARDRMVTSPRQALALAALIAVVASAYPIVFLGKSYVSPDLGTVLLYDDFPTLPGYQTDHIANVRGTDVGAIAWQDLPVAVTQRKALASGELPLWNRYNSCGVPLLGQGQSMFGDPLHFIPLIANSAAWAWDVKYLVAKWLFALGLGLCVLSVTRHLPAALLTTAAAPFIGFFVFRLNHPAFFSECYAPWVLVAWLNFVESQNRRAAAGWLTGLMLANWSLLTSGTAKEAAMLLLCLNFAGALVLLTSAQPWRLRLLRLAGAGWAGILFTLLAAPLVLTFLDTLAASYTSYGDPSVQQIQPSLLLGFFDELFYRPLSGEEMVLNPAMNLLLLGGVLYFLATLRENFAQRAAMALAATALVPLSLIFGFVPARWIVQVPFLGNIAHIDNTFACVLIVLASVLAGVGFRRAFERLGTPSGRGDLLAASLLLFALVFSYVAYTQTVHRSVLGYGTTSLYAKTGESLPVKPFLWSYLWTSLVALAGGAWLLRRTLATARFSAATGIVLLTCALTLVWRNGLQVGSGFEHYVMNPTARVDLHARSAAVEFMRTASAAEPARGVGLRSNFFPGWTGYYSVESIGGPDALINPRYRELMEASGLQRRWDWNYVVTAENVADARPLLDLCNVRFYVDYKSDPDRAPPGLRLARAADLEVYESPTPWPRAFFTDRIVTYEGAADFVQQVRAGDGRPFAAAQSSDLADDHTLDALPRGLTGRAIAPATNYRLTENTTSFRVRATAPGVAVLSEAHLPGDFRAQVDGKDAPIVRVNHAFKGVVIGSAGEHDIAIRYLPRRFSQASWAAIAGGLLLAASLGVVWRKRPTR